MSDDPNPYKPPQSDVAATPDTGPLALLPEARSVSAGAGLEWIKEGWHLFKPYWLTWIGVTFVFFIIQVLLGFIPILGDIASGILNPVFSGGLAMGALAVYKGDALRFDYLFAGFRERFGPLALLGLIIMAVVFLAVIVIGGAFAMMNAGAFATSDFDPVMLEPGVNIWLIIFAVILGLALMMLLWFAVPLVALSNVSPLKALKMSFRACLRNALPLLVYVLLIGVLFILGAIPLMLGLLVVMPVLVTSHFASYKHLFLK